ncbi:anaerobic dimethyl sulfoxide reductase subunit B [Escherichia coli]|uniref:Anaerobic dimethyl sulfoxide reductase subunit B n=1 Tax=Escherichia coli TaxID=562 RepID=A0A377K667_ECOLX|nr:anaerobic dimethyl sulfoxide reductase subunit B [Escherichia coli]
MTTQYGFLSIPAAVLAVKPANWRAKILKILARKSVSRRIYEYAGGDWQEDNGVWHQNVFAYYLSISCNHCDDPACTKVCPSGAMHKREDGFVVVDEDVCIGCRYCHMACPYGAPQYNAEKGHMTKCDGCYSRVARGNNPYVSNPARCVHLNSVQLKSCARSTALWLPLRHCRARISQNPISLSNLTATAARPAIHWLSG